MARKQSSPGRRKATVKKAGRGKAKPVSRIGKPVVRRPVKKKKSIRYHSPLAKKPARPKFTRFKWVRHPKDGQGIRFRIPASWKETAGSEDNALFYPPLPGHREPTPMGGRLFVRFRFESVGQATPEAAYGLLMSHRTDESQVVTQLDSGSYLLHFSAHHHLEGFNSVEFFWILAKPLPSRRVAIASFLFTGVSELFDDPKAPQAAIVKMLQQTIPHAEFDEEVLPVRRSGKSTG
jgi:hypothetical protein